MEIKPKKAVRFIQIIQSAGRPVPVTLWTAPEKDPEFSKARREARVLTVIHRKKGAKADFGLVGFFKEALATYLVFPRRVPYPVETKVIGIKYDQLGEAKPVGPLHRAVTRPVRQMVESKRKNRDGMAAGPDTEGGEIATAVNSSRRDAEKGRRDARAAPEKLIRFRADVELVAKQVVRVEAEARSGAEAERLLKKKGAEVQLNLETAKIGRRVGKPRRMK